MLLGRAELVRYAAELRAKGGKISKALEELEQKEAEVSRERTEKPLPDALDSKIKQFGTSYSRRVASQIRTLAELCVDGRPTALRPLMRYCFELGETLPKKPEFDASIAVDEHVQALTSQFMTLLSIDGGEEIQRDLAARLQHGLNEDSGMPDDGDEDDDRGAVVERRLGILLLLGSRGLWQDIGRIVNEREDSLYDEALTVQISKASNALKEKRNQLDLTMVQGVQAGSWQAMCVEIAKLLVLPTGAINFGILDDVYEGLLPDDYEGTMADLQLKYMVATLGESPDLWVPFYAMEAPKHRSPAAEVIRQTLGLGPDVQLTAHHARLTGLSAYFFNLRQNRAGTCFATSYMIQLMHQRPQMVLLEWVELLKKGAVEHILHGDRREIAYTSRPTHDGMLNVLTVDRFGQLKHVSKYRKSKERKLGRPQPALGTHIWEAPGIIAACRRLGLTPRDCCQLAIGRIGQPTFTVERFLQELGSIRYEQDLGRTYTRSQERFTRKGWFERAQYAFAAQTRHPLITAWESVMAQMMYHMNSQVGFPAWIVLTTKDSFELMCERTPLARPLPTFMRHMYSFMTARMGYRYNHYLQDTYTLFDDGNHGVKAHYDFGFELVDRGTPTDYKHNTKVYTAIQQEARKASYKSFEGYRPADEWELVEGPRGYQAFMCSIIDQTARYMVQNKVGSTDWYSFAEGLKVKVNDQRFPRLAVEKLFGRGSHQSRELQRNPHGMKSTPWLFRWGGWTELVMEAFWSFSKLPTEPMEYSGTPREVLNWILKYLRNHPDREEGGMESPFWMTTMSSPGHAFLLRPCHKRAQEAINSCEPTLEFIDRTVIAPGQELSDSPMPLRARHSLVAYVAENMWTSRYEQKDDMLRQQLTDFSKAEFDQMICGRLRPGMIINQVYGVLVDVVARARACDPKIRKRHEPWEKQMAGALKQKIKFMFPKANPETALRKREIQRVVDFARNRVDRTELSPREAQRFREEMSKFRGVISIKEFRTEMLNILKGIREQETGMRAIDWVKRLSEWVDTKLFKLLPEEWQDGLLKTAIPLCDTNWNAGISHIYFAFVVNPGTGTLELANYNMDKGTLRFWERDQWFKRAKYHNWSLPKHYIRYREEPLASKSDFIDL